MSNPTEVFTGKVSAREFLVDFFGAMMPGVLFVSLITIEFALIIIGFYVAFECAHDNCATTLEYLKKGMKWSSNLSTVIYIAFFLLYLCGAYVIGTLFYRRDPKEGDYKSFIKIASGFKKPSELENWVVKVKTKDEATIEKKFNELRPKILKYYHWFTYKKLLKEIKENKALWDEFQSKGLIDANYNIKTEQAIKELKTNEFPVNPNAEFITKAKWINWLTVDKKEVQFPYNNLAGYLIARNRIDLEDMIPWELNRSEVKANAEVKTEKEIKAELKKSPRSKTLINSLKIQLQFFHPEKCSTIIKNEAHVRLTTSMWYITIALRNYSLAVILLIPVLYFVFWGAGEIPHIVVFLPAIASVSIFLFAWRAKLSLEQFLHYQRVREIFYVLETANIDLNLKKSKVRFPRTKDSEKLPVEPDT